MSALLPHDECFAQLDTILVRWQALWRPAPFRTEPDWPHEHPALTARLMALTDAELETLQGDDSRLLQSMGSLLPGIEPLRALTGLPLAHNPVAPANTRWQCDVPGRKWDQITAFAGALGQVRHPVLEWCSGKAHLGRLLSAVHHVPATGLEVDATLVDDGNALAARLGVDAHVRRCDVLHDAARRFLCAGQHALALHACGGLHVRLLELGSQHAVSRLSIAPCCYHLHGGEHYQALSRAASRSALSLDRDDLRLAVRQSVTSPPRIRRRRAQLQAWRLGFDLLQRELRGVDQYLPVPSLPERLLNGSFEHFCEHVASIKCLTLPPAMDFSRFERLGHERFQRVERLGLVPMAFRRALELWLVLDRVLFLEEQGYECELVQFCPQALTPRNLLIDARR